MSDISEDSIFVEISAHPGEQFNTFGFVKNKNGKMPCFGIDGR